MRRKWKKLLSTTLALAMVVTTIGVREVPVSAAEEEENIGMRDITVLRMSSEREDSLQDAVMTENLAALPENLCWMFFLGKKSAI